MEQVVVLFPSSIWGNRGRKDLSDFYTAKESVSDGVTIYTIEV